jgi:hypothetical protein
VDQPDLSLDTTLHLEVVCLTIDLSRMLQHFPRVLVPPGNLQDHTQLLERLGLQLLITRLLGELQRYPVLPFGLSVGEDGLSLVPRQERVPNCLLFAVALEEVPGELTTLVGFLYGPPAPFLPDSMHGVPLVAIGTCYAGDIEEGMRVVQPIKEFGPPGADLIGPMPYTMHQGLLDPILPRGLRYYVKSVYLDELDDQAIRTLVDHAARMTSPLSLATLQHYRGAVSRVDPDATAYAYRNAGFAVTMGAAWTRPDEDDVHIAWSRDFYADMLPLSHGVYVNFMGMGEGEDRVRAAYGEKTYERLVALKNRYDPTNLFRVNHNIRPTVQA